MKNESIAIVGIGSLFPGSKNAAEFWNNSLRAKCFIREIPEEFWEKDMFYNPDVNAEDKTYSKKGGVLEPMEFNPMEFGIPPKVMQSISVEQIYGLILARQALIDAGLYGENAKTFDKDRTGVIISASVGKNVYQLTSRINVNYMRNFLKNCNVPDAIITEAINNYKNSLLDWDESSNPGYLANVVSGRIANRFNLRGTTCSVDAACASSLAAVKFACQELLMGDCDIMLAGGISMDLSNVTFVSFCKTPALSPSDQIRPFDENADGMLLGDGAGVIVLKRLSKAQADGDRIYGLIEGIGSSSDGKEKSIFSPSKRGQMMAVTNALIRAEVSAAQIGMVEAHGTGTSVGDICEAETMCGIYENTDQEKRSVVMGGCKGQTGHMRLAAGIASLIRATLSIYHKQFVPSVGCETLNKILEKSIFYVCKKPLPWIVNNKRPERYAAVSSFGFGGTNYNVILKEYEEDYNEPYRYTEVPQGIMLCAENKEQLKEELKEFIQEMKNTPEKLFDRQYTYRTIEDNFSRVGFAVETSEEAIHKAEVALKMMNSSDKNNWSFQGIMYADKAIAKEVKVIALFSGQGSQYCNMLSDVAGAYPELRKSLTLVDNALLSKNKTPISDIVYAKAWTEEEKKAAENLLVETQYTQPALAAMEAGLYKIMKHRGLNVDRVMGHSFGELVALYASGAYDEATLMNLAVARGQCMAMSGVGVEKTGMTAVKDSYENVKKLIKFTENVYIANQNSPEQTIVAGSIAALEKVEKAAHEGNIQVKRLKVSNAFHTPYMKKASTMFREELDNVEFGELQLPVTSNFTAKNYSGIKSIKPNLVKQLVNPVRFEESIKSAYQSGHKIFVEIGPGRTLKGIVDKCLSDKEDVITLFVDSKEKSILQLETAMVHLAILGMSIQSDIYSKKMDSEINIKKTKNTYTIPTTFFLLEETKKKRYEAIHKKMDCSWEMSAKNLQTKEQSNCFNNLVQSNIKERDGENMNKYDALYEIQKINSNVIGEYVKLQNEQFEGIKSLMKNDTIKGKSDKELLLQYVNCFQENSLNALRAYFGVSDLLEGDDNQYLDEGKVIEVAEPVRDNNEPEQRIDVKKEVAVTPKAVVIEVSEEEIRDDIIASIADVTGYPADMLETDMVLEGDLGIDSIKRLELFSIINEQMGNIFGQEDMVTLASVQTIQECIELVKQIKEDPNHKIWSEEELEAAREEALSSGLGME
ncbi:MAG: acyltransferase domain-containing protein [Eubacterium sp.]|nr:acyltransferase domain-containing protein [Eubacterium sp.]